MPAYIDERLLVEECLLAITDHALGCRLEAESGLWLDKFTSGWHLALLLHFFEILVLLVSVFWIGNFINIFAHDVLELVVLHRLREVKTEVQVGLLEDQAHANDVVGGGLHAA